MGDAEDKRIHVRISTVVPCVVQSTAGVNEGRLADLSRSGAQLETDMDVGQESEMITLGMGLPEDTVAVQCKAEIVRRLGERGVSAYAVDVTSPDVEELGLRVARVITPELCALDVFGAAPYRGGERLYRAAFDDGLLDVPLTYDELNPLPHPYP